MEPQSFASVTADLEAELRRLNYTSGSLAFYRRVWRRLSLFLER
jgi:hypothetical protein